MFRPPPLLTHTVYIGATAVVPDPEVDREVTLVLRDARAPLRHMPLHLVKRAVLRKLIKKHVTWSKYEQFP